MNATAGAETASLATESVLRELRSTAAVRTRAHALLARTRRAVGVVRQSMTVRSMARRSWSPRSRAIATATGRSHITADGGISRRAASIAAPSSTRCSARLMLLNAHAPRST